MLTRLLAAWLASYVWPRLGQWRSTSSTEMRHVFWSHRASNSWSRQDRQTVWVTRWMRLSAANWSGGQHHEQTFTAPSDVRSMTTGPQVDIIPTVAVVCRPLEAFGPTSLPSLNQSKRPSSQKTEDTLSDPRPDVSALLVVKIGRSTDSRFDVASAQLLGRMTSGISSPSLSAADFPRSGCRSGYCSDHGSDTPARVEAPDDPT